MAGAGVHDTQGVAGLREVIPRFLHNRGGRVGKVNGHRSAHRGAHLVHQAAGLAKIDVLRILTDLGDLNGVQMIPAAEMVENIANEHLIGGGGAQP